jgi:diguanylate cyclase (GGDEF)-like protein/PAS domain S-box-containing protein
MNLAAVLIPPGLERKQALRLQRLGVAALAYALTLALVMVAWLFGVLPGYVALEVVAAYLAINMALYAVIRSGFNLRFREPGLARVQILIAITVVMYIAYHMTDGREVALFGCFIVYLFGVFHLGGRQLTGVTLYTLAAYALVIYLLMHGRTEAIPSVPRAWLSWLALAISLPCFTIIGGQINALRRRLAESEARFRGLTEMSSDFFWESDAGHRLTERSMADRKLGGASQFQRGVEMGERRWDIPSLSPDEAGWLAHRATLDAHAPFRNFEHSRLGTDGTERHISISGDPVFDALGAFKGYHGVGTDITARMRADEALRDSAQQLRLFADNIPAMTVSWDENLRCRFANKVFTKFFDLGAGGIIGKHASEVFGDEMYREIELHFAQVLKGRPVTYQTVNKLGGGESRYLEFRLLPHLGDHGRIMGCFAVTTDITEHKLAEKRMERVAHHDSLTGLPNRLLFDDRLDQAIFLAKRNRRQFALLYVDLDRFKPVNDTLGHTAGDEILRGVATRMQGQLRESDTVARIGGDEFLVILPDVGKRDHAEIVAKKLIAALAMPFRLGSHKRDIVIGASVGIALYPDDGLGAEALVRVADAAMYSAKQAGIGFVPWAA